MPAFLIALLLFLQPPLQGQENSEAPETSAQKPQAQIEQINPYQYRIGKILLDQKTREIRFGAGVNMTEGLLEFLIVGTQSNKVHESLFLTDISPFHLNIAMKLLGITESPELFEIVDEDYRPTGKFPEVPQEVRKKARVTILVKWGEGDQKKVVPVSEMIHFINWPDGTQSGLQPNQEVTLNDLKLSSMKNDPWLSTGSYIHEGKLKAEVLQIVAAIYTSQQALLNYPGKGRLNGDVWIPNQKVVPEEGTEVKIIIKPSQL